MENPATEIANVIARLTSSATPDVQKDTVLKYFTSDAGFRHALCAVNPGPRSREHILGIYRWYRVMASHVDVAISGIVFDESKPVLFCDVQQHFHVRASPFGPRISNLTVKLILRKESDGLYYIAFQDDFFQPDEAAALALPVLYPILHIGLRLVPFFCLFAAHVAGMLGIWSPGKGQVGRAGKLRVEGEETRLHDDTKL